MTQNLDLVLNTNQVFTPADTDMSEGAYTPPRNTLTVAQIPTDYADGTYDTYSIDTDSYFTNNTSQRYDSLDACVRAGHDETSCQHWRAGVLYGYFVATVHPQSYITEAFAPNSICPKGWRLLSSTRTGDEEEDGTSDAYKLVNAYGITNDTAGSFALRSAPFYASLAGIVYENETTPAGWHALGSHAQYWTNAVVGRYFGRSFLITSSWFLTWRTNTGSYPKSIRCIAR